MQKQLLCIKIKDALYIGNRIPAEDMEFMLTNKFAYVLNCTSEIPNYFQSIGNIKYCKLKYDRNKHKLWGQTFKKLQKIMKFIQESQNNAECCLIHSNLGNNRCCAVVIAYLMKKFYWSFDKSLLYLKSKKVQIKLSIQYINQLKSLEQHLKMDTMISYDFKSLPLNDEQLILSNTYNNTMQIKYSSNIIEKREKHIQWKDKIEKQRNKEKNKEIIIKETKNMKNIKSQKEFDSKPQVKNKKKKNQVLPKSLEISEPNYIQKKKNQQKENDLKENFIIGSRSKELPVVKQIEQLQNQNQKKIPIYNLTVNNYINPNIQIYPKQKVSKSARPVSSDPQKKNLKKMTEQPSQIGSNTEEQIKISRTFSQKQHRTLNLKQKSKNILNSNNNSLMNSLMGFQQNIKQTISKKMELMNKYRSTNVDQVKPKTQNQFYLHQNKKLEKSMSFQSRTKK